MRRFAFLIAAGTTFIALFFGGFAVFAPKSVDAPTPPAEVTVPTERGEAAGRLASMSFSAVASSAIPAQRAISLDPLAFDGLFRASQSQDELESGSLSTTTTVAPTTTTTPDSTTTTSTRPSTTTTRPQATTTTVPPTTTTSSTTMPPTTTTTSSTTTTTTPASTTTTSTTVPAGGPLTEGEMRELAGRFFPVEELDKAVLVAWCESGYDPNAYNPAGPYGGLYQHAERFWDSRAAAAGFPGASIFDAEANTAAAHLLWASSGWTPWPWCSAWADGQLGG